MHELHCWALQNVRSQALQQLGFTLHSLPVGQVRCGRGQQRMQAMLPWFCPERSGSADLRRMRSRQVPRPRWTGLLHCIQQVRGRQRPHRDIEHLAWKVRSVPKRAVQAVRWRLDHSMLGMCTRAFRGSHWCHHVHCLHRAYLPREHWPGQLRIVPCGQVHSHQRG